jgi:hypothetical protein
MGELDPQLVPLSGARVELEERSVTAAFDDSERSLRPYAAIRHYAARPLRRGMHPIAHRTFVWQTAVFDDGNVASAESMLFERTGNGSIQIGISHE